MRSPRGMAERSRCRHGAGSTRSRATCSRPGTRSLRCVPAQGLRPLADSERVVYPLVFRLFVSDSMDDLVARLDTTRAFGAREPLRGESFLTGQLMLAVPPGRYRYRLLVEQLGENAGDL